MGPNTTEKLEWKHNRRSSQPISNCVTSLSPYFYSLYTTAFNITCSTIVCIKCNTNYLYNEPYLLLYVVMYKGFFLYSPYSLHLLHLKPEAEISALAQ